MIKKHILNPIASAFLFQAMLKLSSYAHVSFIWGSQLAFFSATSIIVPLSGAFAGISGSFAVFGLGLIIRCLITHSFSFHLLAYHIPGLCASLYWATSSKIVRIMPVLLCIILFMAHPVGNNAALYTLFWIIPIVITLFVKEHLFAQALASTFSAHAVGSVIWLYTLPTTSDMWLMLIPIVVIERLLFASGMVIAYHVINWIVVPRNSFVAHRIAIEARQDL